jgi:hypothetical protein
MLECVKMDNEEEEEEREENILERKPKEAGRK